MAVTAHAVLPLITVCLFTDMLTGTKLNVQKNTFYHLTPVTHSRLICL